MIDDGRASRPVTKLAGMLAVTAASESTSRAEAFGRLTHMLDEVREKAEREARITDDLLAARCASAQPGTIDARGRFTPASRTTCRASARTCS
jgi:hypothetical protein